MTPVKASGNSLPVLISGYYGFNNLGDEAILESILNWFVLRDDIHPVVLSVNPKATAEMFGVDAIHRNNIFQLIGRMAGSPLLIQGGGGLLQDKTSSRSLMYYLGVLLLGSVTGRRLVAFGQGIGPLEGEFAPLLTGEFLSQCDMVAVRDFTSFSFCQQRMPLKANIQLMADAAFMLEAADPDIVEDIFIQENLDLPPKPLVAFCVRGPMKDRRQITAIARTINMTLEELGGGVVLFPFHHPHDLKYAEEIRKLVENRDDLMIFKGIYKPSEALGVLGKCDLVVGMRLHSIIFAALQGVPFVPVSYDPKIDELIKEFGMKSSLHTPLVGPETLFDAIMDTWENRGKMKIRITDSVGRIRGRSKEGFDALGEYIESIGLRQLGIKRGASRRKSTSSTSNN